MSRVKGIISTRRLLKRIPDAIRDELATTIRGAGPELQNAIVARAPRGATGRLIAGISWKFYAATLRLSVGFVGKRTNQKLFYARILEFGRRAQTVTVHRLNKKHRKEWVGRIGAGTARGSVKPADLGTTYSLRVKALKPRRFVYSPTTNLRNVMNQRLNGIWDRALKRVSSVGDE